nr:EOG090X0GJG [Lepidurus arcticus]
MQRTAEETQQRLYFLHEKLQEMTKELPPKYQQRLPIELLSSLANALLSDTIFEIVVGLSEIQQITEKQLLHQRLELLKKQKGKLKQFVSSEVIEEIKLSQEEQRTTLAGRLKEEQKQFDMNIILQLDQKVREQQAALEGAGVPGFHVTNTPDEVQVQMYLLQFIIKLARMNTF